MYRSLEIEGFRCFKHLSMDGLSRVNLVTGKNNSGKTCLLEALYLTVAPNKPELAMRLAAFRGIEKMPAVAEEVFGWLFFERKTGNSIRLITKDENGTTDELELHLASQLELPIDDALVPPSTGGTDESTYSQLVYLYRRGENTYTSRLVLRPKGELRMEEAEQLPIQRQGVIVPTGKRFPQEMAKKYSQLEERGEEHKVLTTMKAFEPRLRKLSVLSPYDTAEIYADIGLGRLVPLNLLGEGTGRLLQIILDILTTEGGVVLVDEIENGIHHSALQTVWKTIGNTCRKANVQLVATTHSRECIQAAYEAFSKRRSSDFRLLRLDRDAGDNISAVMYDSEMLEAAFATDLEVR